ncbi:MAG: tol-pal system protein YbgF [Thermodesulfobacteriota bacterium]
MRTRSLWAMAAVLLSGLLTSCITEGDFRQFQGEVRRDLSVHDQQIRELRQQMREVQEERDKRGKQFADYLNDLTVLQREVSNLRGQVDSLSVKGVEDLRKAQIQLRQELEALKARIEQLAVLSPPPQVSPQPVPPGPPGPPTPPPAERAEELYKAAMFRFEEGDFTKAREGFQGILTRHPESALADNAQFWVGECYFREGNFKQAILEYEKVISQFPRSGKVPSALLKQGMAFEKLGDLESARYLYSKVTKEHPDSEQARMAEHRLKNIP